MSILNPSRIKLGFKKRSGRGISAGKGKTAGRGTKGQKSRSGYNIPRGFEGGQTTLISRLPKAKGFRSLKKQQNVVKVNDLQTVKSKIISPKTLYQANLISSTSIEVKIIGNGDLPKGITFQAVRLSKPVKDRYLAMRKSKE